MSKYNVSAAEDNPGIQVMPGLDSTYKEKDINNCNDFTAMPKLSEIEGGAIQEQDLEAHVQVTAPKVSATNVDHYVAL